MKVMISGILLREKADYRIYVKLVNTTQVSTMTISRTSSTRQGLRRSILSSPGIRKAAIQESLAVILEFQGKWAAKTGTYNAEVKRRN